MIFKLKHNQVGDTIVEVLIAVAIVGSVMAGAFAISSRSLKQIRQSQERTEAQKIASSYVEKLNKFYKFHDSSMTTTPFCTIDTPSPNGSIVSPVDTQCNSGADNRYRTKITRIAAASKVFEVSVSWDGLSGNTENVTFSYRVKEPI